VRSNLNGKEPRIKGLRESLQKKALLPNGSVHMVSESDRGETEGKHLRQQKKRQKEEKEGKKKKPTKQPTKKRRQKRKTQRYRLEPRE